MENYEYIADLGSGSYGFVWQCLQRSSGRIVAVKGFKLAHTDKKFLDQAIREVRMLKASCDHPNVVQLLEAFRSSSGRVYMVFEFVERCLSADLHKRFTCGLPATQTRLVLWQLLCAVAHLHSKKIIHRDIKPGNLLMTADGVLKLCDFGFARTTRGEPYQPDRFSSYVVTRWYRSPEMLVSDLYSAASDIWSLGCTFAEIATGRPLFPGTSSLDQLWRIMRCLGPLPYSQAERFAAAATAAGLPEPPPPPPRGKSLWQRLPELDARLLDVVQACLRLDPRQRPTAAQLLQMPYFLEVPKLIAGTPLDKLYSEHATPSYRCRTTSGRTVRPQEQPQQQPGGPTAPPPPPQQQPMPPASRGVAVKVMSSDELVQEAMISKDRGIMAIGGDGSDGRSSRRAASVLLSAVAASLLGEPPAPPGGNGSIQLMPLLSVPSMPTPAAPSLDNAVGQLPPAVPPPPPPAVAVAAAAPTPRPGGAATSLPAPSGSFRTAPTASVSSMQTQSPSPPTAPPSSQTPLPPTTTTATTGSSNTRSGTSPLTLPPLTQQTSRNRLRPLSRTPSAALLTAAAAATATAAGVAGRPPVQATQEKPGTPDFERGHVHTQADAAMRGGEGPGCRSAAVDMEAGVAVLVRGRSSTCDGGTDGSLGQPGAAKRLQLAAGGGGKDGTMSVPGGDPAARGGAADAAAVAAVAAAAAVGDRAPSKTELISPQRDGAASVDVLLSGDPAIDPRAGFGAADGVGGVSTVGLGLLPDGPEDIFSDGDGHISDDDELMEYFAAKTVGSGLTVAASGGGGDAVAAAGASRRDIISSSTLAASNATAAAAAGSGAAAGATSSGVGVGSSASLRRLPVDGPHAGVQGVHHGLYGGRQGSGGAGGGSLTGATPMNRRVAAMVMRTADLTSASSGGGTTGGGGGGDAAGAQHAPPSRHTMRATVGSYLTVPPAPPPPQATAAAPPQEATATMAKPATVLGGMRPRTAGVSCAIATEVGLYRSPGNGAISSSGGVTLPHPAIGHAGLPSRRTHHITHAMTTTTGTGLTPSSSIPYAAATNYGRTSVPTGGYVVGGTPYNAASATAMGGSRRAALSRQGSVVFNQLMYDALPEIGTPGGAPDVPAGTPPRRRAVMSGFTPCRTAAARAAAEGIPPAAAMAAVLGEALQSTTDLSVAYSPININRSVELLFSERESGPPSDAATNTDAIAASGGGGSAAAAAAVALRRHHRRYDQSATTAVAASASSIGGGGADAAAAASAVHPGVASSASCHTYQVAAAAGAASCDTSGLVLGSSAPTSYPHHHHHHCNRMQRAQENTPSTISSVVGPVPIPGNGGGSAAAAASRAQHSLTSGGGSAASSSPGTSIGTGYATPPSGARGFQLQTSLTPATARSRLASGNMAREGHVNTGRYTDPELQSADLDPLGSTGWVASGYSPAGMAIHAAHQQLQPAAAAVAAAAIPPPAMRGRLGRWASGLIDSLPEDREVLHATYGNWHGSYADCSTEPGGGGGGDDAIQMLGADGSTDWPAATTAAGIRSGGGGAANAAPAATGSQVPMDTPLGVRAGPWPPPSSQPRMPRSGSGVDPRVIEAAAAAAATTPPPLPFQNALGAQPRPSSPSLTHHSPGPSGSPHMPSGRSRRTLQLATSAVASPAASSAGVMPASNNNSNNSRPPEQLTPISATAATAAAAATARGGRLSEPAAAESAYGIDPPVSDNAGGGGGGARGVRSSNHSGSSSSSSRSKWPRAKAFLGGRLLSSLVKKFKPQEPASDK